MRQGSNFRSGNRSIAERYPFSSTFGFVPEIQNRTGIAAARLVRSWLAARGVGTRFELMKGRYLGFKRAEVEVVLEREAAQAKIAAE